MHLKTLVPGRASIELKALDDLLENLRVARRQPFEEVAVEFVATLSQDIFARKDLATQPDLAALAYWARKASLKRLQDRHPKLPLGFKRVPRGLTLHIPPTNVATMFCYSWLLALLAGCPSVVRISGNSPPQTFMLCDLLRELLARPRFASLQASQLFLEYGHEADINGKLSAGADVRILWGGDETIQTFRAFSSPPGCKDIVFRDRFSMSALNAVSYLAASRETKTRVVAAFFNDSFSLDQMACSSPRLILWCGPSERCSQASISFKRELQAEIQRRNYVLETGPVMDKITYAHKEAAVHGGARVDMLSNELFVMKLPNSSALEGEYCGGGFFFEAFAPQLHDVVTFAKARYQTLTHFGFDEQSLVALADELRGAAFDRIVPIGKALDFHEYWDGYDIIGELTRAVHIDGENVR